MDQGGGVSPGWGEATRGEQIGYPILDRKAKVKGDLARPAILVTGDESYGKERYVELLLRAAETLPGPLGYPAERIQSLLAAF